MLSFLKQWTQPKTISSTFSDEFRNHSSLELFLKEHSATLKHDCYDFDETRYNEYCSGLLEIVSVRLFDMIRTDKAVISELKDVEGDCVFIECAFFLLYSIRGLSKWGILDYNRSGENDFDDFLSNSAPFWDKLFYHCPLSCYRDEEDFDDLSQDRLELYIFDENVVDPMKAMIYKFAQTLHQRRTPYRFDYTSDYLSEAPQMMMLHSCVETRAAEALLVLVQLLTRPLYNYRFQRD